MGIRKSNAYPKVVSSLSLPVAVRGGAARVTGAEPARPACLSPSRSGLCPSPPPQGGHHLCVSSRRKGCGVSLHSHHGTTLFLPRSPCRAITRRAGRHQPLKNVFVAENHVLTSAALGASCVPGSEGALLCPELPRSLCRARRGLFSPSLSAYRVVKPASSRACCPDPALPCRCGGTRVFLGTDARALAVKGLGRGGQAGLGQGRGGVGQQAAGHPRAAAASVPLPCADPLLTAMLFSCR